MSTTLNNLEIQKDRLKKIVSLFNSKRVLVLGDLILDEYLQGYPERISREAPVIILQYQNSVYKLGGAANAAHNLAQLGANTYVIGITGLDSSASKMVKLFTKAKIEPLLIGDKSRHTTLKTRVVSSSSSDPDAGTVVKQQVLRIDRQDKHTINKETEDKILQNFRTVLDSHMDSILLSDYDCGLLGYDICQYLITEATQRNIKVIVDASQNFDKYQGAYSMTPNQPDVEKALKSSIKSEEDLHNSGIKLLELLKSQHILVTRGAKGMALFQRESINSRNINLTEIPAFNLSKVFDVSGAGDTVSATYTLSLACGANNIEAAILGNLAASIVVKKYGTATTNSDELLSAIDSLEV